MPSRLYYTTAQPSDLFAILISPFPIHGRIYHGLEEAHNRKDSTDVSHDRRHVIVPVPGRR